MTAQLDQPEPDVATVHVVTTRERLAGVVQSVGRRPDDIERRWWESALVFGLFLVAYTWFGYWLVVDMHVVGFETLDRFNRALMIWHNDPPKLSSVGFDYPPLTILLISPLTIVPALASSLIAVPLASSVFAAFTMVIFNTMMRRAQVLAPLRVIVLVAFGLNPLIALYAASGARHFMWLAFVVAALGALFAWYVTADIRFVMIAGLAFAVAALSGYSSLLWFVVSAVMVGAILARLGADGTEIEGTTVGFAAPTVYVIALWSVFNLILVLKPFNWITASSDSASSGGLESFSAVELLEYTGRLVLYGAPIAIVVLPALVFAGIARRNSLALWLAVILFLSIIVPAVSVALKLTDSPMVMRNALPILLFSMIGAIWLARSAGDGATLVSALLVAGLIISIPWTFQAMKTYKYQGLESTFAAAVSTRQSQEGATTPDGSTVGYVSEQAMATWIKDNVSLNSSILTDNAQTSAVILLTGDPALFFDRVDKSDGPWLSAAKDPAAHVDYMLLSTGSSEDLLSNLYEDAVDGSNAFLTEAYRTDRYVLVSVPSGFRRGADSLGDEDPAALSIPGQGITTTPVEGADR
ncbi:hypothetical protein [Nocardioides sp.]|uniref:hypothetical protein n=1 Tax=Nocardioides sp. TaxID=35761 RepID=UPI00286B2A57|nr:hypothetical protein [Nocardioides sp.]